MRIIRRRSISFRTSPIPLTRIQISDFRSPHSQCQLSVYDLLGREVAVLVDRSLGPGTYEAEFNASGLPSGAYFYRLRALRTPSSGATPETEQDLSRQRRRCC
ncbi:MAG: T9SS type A sorting domain-containing protein [Ignavibacteriae bacterium]|nr:T9SS type A sorting domain-containing protein [Ignavibacteriota bacterium]